MLALADSFYRAAGRPEALAKAFAGLAKHLGAEQVRLAEAEDPAPGQGSEGDRSQRFASSEGLQLEIVRSRPLSAGERSLLAALAPHVVRALGTAVASPAPRHVSAVALDRLAVGVLVLDEIGRLLHANRAAQRLLDAGEGVREEGGAIEIAHTRAADILADLRARSEEGKRSRPSARISIQREGRSPLEVFAVSIDDMEVEDGGSLALFISDPESGLEPPPSLLREHYGLSRREAEVVGQILLGRSLEEAATALGIHRETIRMHLKQVFRKVGTRRQVDLVRLLLSGVPRLNWE